jgi:cytochrome c553
VKRRDGVLIVDDHPIVLRGCRRILDDAGVKVVLEARDVTSAYKLYLRHHPRVVIIDLAISGNAFGGLLLIRRISRHDPVVGILVFSMYTDPVIVARALEAGATGYVGRQKALRCQTCHGLDGKAKLPEAPNLAGESEICLIKGLKDYRTGARKNDMMSLVAPTLKDQDIDDLAAYFSAIEVTVGPAPK